MDSSVGISLPDPKSIPADQLFERVTCKAIDGVAMTADDAGEGKRPPRSKADFKIECRGEKDLPEGIALERWI